jgi:hypothetical protein
MAERHEQERYFEIRISPNRCVKLHGTVGTHFTREKSGTKSWLAHERMAG